MRHDNGNGVFAALNNMKMTRGQPKYALSDHALRRVHFGVAGTAVVAI